MQLNFNIPLSPVAKARPRFTKKGFAYTPQKTKQFENDVKTWLLANHKGPIMDGGIGVTVTFFIKTPKKPKCGMPIGRPDIDNLQKGLFDAFNGIVWKDDSQVWSCYAKKLYAVEPGISITVWQ